jgi:hypothetical protein
MLVLLELDLRDHHCFAATESRRRPGQEPTKAGRRKFRRPSSLCSPELVVMSDNIFLLYPIDTGEDPVCLGCGTQMTVATHEVRETKPDFISFRCPNCGRSEKFLWEE